MRKENTHKSEPNEEHRTNLLTLNESFSAIICSLSSYHSLTVPDTSLYLLNKFDNFGTLPQNLGFIRDVDQ